MRQFTHILASAKHEWIYWKSTDVTRRRTSFENLQYTASLLTENESLTPDVGINHYVNELCNDLHAPRICHYTHQLLLKYNKLPYRYHIGYLVVNIYYQMCDTSGSRLGRRDPLVGGRQRI